MTSALMVSTQGGPWRRAGAGTNLGGPKSVPNYQFRRLVSVYLCTGDSCRVLKFLTYKTSGLGFIAGKTGGSRSFTMSDAGEEQYGLAAKLDGRFSYRYKKYTGYSIVSASSTGGTLQGSVVCSPGDPC